MGVSPSQETVLNELVVKVPDDVTWCLFGSVDTVLRGLTADPDDVDVLTTKTGAGEFREVFSEQFVERRTVDRSRLDEYRLHGEELEVISRAPETAREEYLVDFGAVECTRTADREMPLLPVEALVDAYRDIDKEESADRLAAEFDLVDE